MKTDPAQLQARRDRAARLFDKGLTQAEVARRLGVSRVTAMRWYHTWAESGRNGLRLAGRYGRPPKLSEEQLDEIETELLRGPPAHGWSTDLWTLSRVAKLIEDRTGVRYHPGHVWRVLRRLGWSLQRPTTRARERDDQKVLEWTKKVWPKTKKGRVRAGRSSS